MMWFLERISARSLPISFGIKDKAEYPQDFAKLVQKKVLKHSSNLDAVECNFCEAENWHECQVRNKDGKLSYVCDNGNGAKKLTDEDVAIFECDNANFLRTLTDELGLSVDRASHKDETEYSNDALFRLGMYENKEKKMKVEVYYLRNNDDFEPSILFKELGNQPKMLITNTMRANIVSGKENLSTCILSEILAPQKKKDIFDKDAFTRCFDAVRRVRFDPKQGNLFLDEKLVYTAGLNSREYHFLACLWERWQQQVPHSDIHQSVKDAIGQDVADAAQKFCNKMKSNIKKTYAGIDGIIITPTTGYYMMRDPKGETRDKKEK